MQGEKIGEESGKVTFSEGTAESRRWPENGNLFPGELDFARCKSHK